jgi:hypothetical protein
MCGVAERKMGADGNIKSVSTKGAKMFRERSLIVIYTELP